MAVLDPNPYPLTAPEYGVPFNEWASNSEFAALVEASENLPDGEIVGGLLRWQRADGYAYYLVTADTPLTLQHVPFMDAWTVEPALIRGLDETDVREMLARERRLRDLFRR